MHDVVLVAVLDSTDHLLKEPSGFIFCHLYLCQYITLQLDKENTRPPSGIRLHDTPSRG